MPGFLSEALTWSENYHIALAVETAIGLNRPPTEFIIYGRNGGSWSEVDKKLAIAFTIMQKEKCGGCGHPVWVCRNTSNKIDFSVRSGMCYAKAKESKMEERRNKQKNFKPKHGEYNYVVPVMVDGSDIPHGLRGEYYEALAEDE